LIYFAASRLGKLRSLRVAFDNHGVPLSSGGTGGQQGELLVLVDQTVRRGANKAAAGGSKRVTQRERAAPEVEPVLREGPDLLRGSQLFLGKLGRVKSGLVGQHLASKGLMDLKDPDVGDLQACPLEELVGGIARAEEELVLGVLGNVDVVAEVRQGLVAELLCLLLRHQEDRRGTVGQEGCVSRGDGAMGLDKGWAKRGELLNRGLSSDTWISGGNSRKKSEIQRNTTKPTKQTEGWKGREGKKPTIVNGNINR